MSSIEPSEDQSLVQQVAETGVELLETICLGLNVHPAEIITEKRDNEEAAAIASQVKEKYTELFNQLKLQVQNADKLVKAHESKELQASIASSDASPQTLARVAELEQEVENRKDKLRILLQRLQELQMLVQATV